MIDVTATGATGVDRQPLESIDSHWIDSSGGRSTRQPLEPLESINSHWRRSTATGVNRSTATGVDRRDSHWRRLTATGVNRSTATGVDRRDSHWSRSTRQPLEPLEWQPLEWQPLEPLNNIHRSTTRPLKSINTTATGTTGVDRHDSHWSHCWNDSHHCSQWTRQSITGVHRQASHWRCRHNLCLHLYFIEAQFVPAPLLHYTQRGTICACTSTSLHPTTAPLLHYTQRGTICACTSTSLHPTRHNLCLHLYLITSNEAQQLALIYIVILRGLR